ncbi:unnamed protein product [Withania somnifera]
MALSSSLGLTLALLFMYLAFLPCQSVSMAIGSRPPGCLNKCMSCHPCKATLVISPSQKNKGGTNSNTDPSKRQAEDDTYYLLSWKCRCNDQLFQP